MKCVARMCAYPGECGWRNKCLLDMDSDGEIIDTEEAREAVESMATIMESARPIVSEHKCILDTGCDKPEHCGIRGIKPGECRHANKIKCPYCSRADFSVARWDIRWCQTCGAFGEFVVNQGWKWEKPER